MTSIVEYTRELVKHVHARIAADATVLAHLVDPSRSDDVARANGARLVEARQHEPNPSAVCVVVTRNGIDKDSCAEPLTPTLGD